MIALFFDTETTGFRSSTFTPEIVQIGAILQDTETQRVVAELNLIIQPKEHIPEKVAAIHGITDDVAAKYGVSNYRAASMFTELVLLTDMVVAHNLAFDLDIVQGAWPAAYEALAQKTRFCTMRETVHVLKLPKNGSAFHDSLDSQYKAPKLVEAYRHFFNTDFDNAHDAMADVRACRDVFFAVQALVAKG